ncbi:MAG: ATP-binding protein [Candidatus Saccharibacteria bacterium]|nr:ATP-binding protein [Candidatus Saccharibacteria bacterium]
MGLFNRKQNNPANSPDQAALVAARHAALADIALNNISDGVVITNAENKIQLVNPAAITMLGHDPAGVINLDANVVFRFETPQGIAIEDSNSQFLLSLRNSRYFTTRDYVLINAQGQKHPIALSVTPAMNAHGEKIITFRDISKELESEGEQSEFISTASHEMRTPVASIEGYLGLALNPNCATIDDRAKKYLEEAHASSKHLGKLFQDLLDVTQLDDKKLKVHLVPIEVSALIREIADGQVPMMSEKGLKFTYGSTSNMGDSAGGHVLDQEIYAAVDIDFLREVMNNLIENAIKYTPNGGGIWVNVRGDGDRVLINVTDTGIGISPDDLKHIFQKFYRADNSQTRTIGGTGLGLYLVKERVEAMGGKVWAESSFGEGSTFYVSFPRLTWEEYERRRNAVTNNMMPQPGQAVTPSQPIMSTPDDAAAPAPAPVQAPVPAAQPIVSEPALPTPPMSTPTT